ncbi:hypothetical protein BDK51DRAFT_39150 [Blyttiomyces helicus]|uniref:Uncharacterized protein n=1 Tax=Blyttiomyces helicus TaxID=388810 RepID=A0A4V1IRM9_9FUNG|nr:hypothetical protein BDK51DRAFT_39150 [Blyttiomyces helicus]|eukprot:RKO90617.1 hypothetical protein BDK51DRAFT_39150 [Blyttiomyces helicus]
MGAEPGRHGVPWPESVWNRVGFDLIRTPEISLRWLAGPSSKDARTSQSSSPDGGAYLCGYEASVPDLEPRRFRQAVGLGASPIEAASAGEEQVSPAARHRDMSFDGQRFLPDHLARLRVQASEPGATRSDVEEFTLWAEGQTPRRRKVDPPYDIAGLGVPAGGRIRCDRVEDSAVGTCAKAVTARSGPLDAIEQPARRYILSFNLPRKGPGPHQLFVPEESGPSERFSSRHKRRLTWLGVAGDDRAIACVANTVSPMHVSGPSSTTARTIPLNVDL